MAFENARLTHLMREYNADETELLRVKASVIITDTDYPGEEKYIELVVDDASLQAMHALPEGSPAQYNAFMAWIKPKVAEAHAAWVGQELPGRRKRQDLNRADVAHIWSGRSLEIDTLN